MKSRAGVLLGALVVTAVALTQAYKVEPRTAEWSGWTSIENNRVSQIITCNFDSLAGGYVELFGGANGGQDYELVVYAYPGGTPVTWSVDCEYEKPYDWVRFDIESSDLRNPDLIVKGKQLEFRFTRAGADSIECAAMTNA